MKMGMLLFMLLPLLGNVYVLWHVWRIVPFAPWMKTAVVVLMVIAFLLLFVSLGYHTRMSMPVATVVYEIGTSWLIILLYLAMAFILLDVGRLVHLVPSSFLKDSWAGTLTVAGALLALFIYGNVHYHHKVRQPLELKTTKHLSRPLKVIMASDLHLGYHNRRAELARWVDMMNKEKADLILIAGDIIDNSTRPLDEERVEEEFLRLNAPVVACLGNHEYYAGEPNSMQFYRKCDIQLLRDSTITMGDLCIIGRDDRTNPQRKSVAELMRMADRDKYVILLDHQPYHLERTEKAGVDFQLSGHTHHGQVWPISWITDAIYECAYGEWQRGATRYYVSSGLGIWGGKFRIGTCSEYIVATISADSTAK
ncbi:MAG: metallophosphoesterase [Prevotella sp.]|nr:metallophosphoesterase [Prevotella sp.]MBR1462619.1 metallophosphoesterase [Prevotella sp.]